MQIQVEIGFEQLVNVVQSLPKSKLAQLKTVIEKIEKQQSKLPDLELILLSGPTATEDQLNVIEENRKAINNWNDFN